MKRTAILLLVVLSSSAYAGDKPEDIVTEFARAFEKLDAKQLTKIMLPGRSRSQILNSCATLKRHSPKVVVTLDGTTSRIAKDGSSAVVQTNMEIKVDGRTSSGQKRTLIEFRLERRDNRWLIGSFAVPGAEKNNRLLKEVYTISRGLVVALGKRDYPRVGALVGFSANDRADFAHTPQGILRKTGLGELSRAMLCKKVRFSGAGALLRNGVVECKFQGTEPTIYFQLKAGWVKTATGEKVLFLPSVVERPRKISTFWGAVAASNGLLSVSHKKWTKRERGSKVWPEEKDGGPMRRMSVVWESKQPEFFVIPDGEYFVPAIIQNDQARVPGELLSFLRANQMKNKDGALKQIVAWKNASEKERPKILLSLLRNPDFQALHVDTVQWLFDNRFFHQPLTDPKLKADLEGLVTLLSKTSPKAAQLLVRSLGKRNFKTYRKLFEAALCDEATYWEAIRIYNRFDRDGLKSHLLHRLKARSFLQLAIKASVVFRKEEQFFNDATYLYTKELISLEKALPFLVVEKNIPGQRIVAKIISSGKDSDKATVIDAVCREMRCGKQVSTALKEWLESTPVAAPKQHSSRHLKVAFVLLTRGTPQVRASAKGFITSRTDKAEWQPLILQTVRQYTRTRIRTIEDFLYWIKKR